MTGVSGEGPMILCLSLRGQNPKGSQVILSVTSSHLDVMPLSSTWSLPILLLCLTGQHHLEEFSG